MRVAGIVTGRKFKISDKGRFAFIQLSDMGGIFEVSVFNEALLNQQRDLLENGKILFIAADAKIEEAGSRLIAQQISLLDEAWAKKRQAKGNVCLKIMVNRAEAIEPIRNLIGAPGGTGTAVRLLAQIDQQQADIQLPDKYSISADILEKYAFFRASSPPKKSPRKRFANNNLTLFLLLAAILASYQHVVGSHLACSAVLVLSSLSA